MNRTCTWMLGGAIGIVGVPAMMAPLTTATSATGSLASSRSGDTLHTAESFTRYLYDTFDGGRFLLEDPTVAEYEMGVSLGVLPREEYGTPITCIGEWGFVVPCVGQQGTCFCEQSWIEASELGEGMGMSNPYFCALRTGEEVECWQALTFYDEIFGARYLLANVSSFAQNGCLLERVGLPGDSLQSCVAGCGQE